jgi:hypothetical protein
MSRARRCAAAEIRPGGASKLKRRMSATDLRLMRLWARIALVIIGLLAVATYLPVGRTNGAERKLPAQPLDAQYRLDAASAKRDGARLLSPSDRRAGFHFAAGTAPGDQQLFLAAVAEARPEARRLIGLVDGLVTVRFAPTPRPGAIGLTQGDETARYLVTIDLALVMQRFGPRGVARTVLHELGHVVDFALVTDELAAALDAGIPRGLGCEQGKLGACAAPPERFAESFAKWALGDIGVNLDIGYKVPPPAAPLSVWGAPLARLAAAG